MVIAEDLPESHLVEEFLADPSDVVLSTTVGGTTAMHVEANRRTNSRFGAAKNAITAN